MLLGKFYQEKVEINDMTFKAYAQLKQGMIDRFNHDVAAEIAYSASVRVINFAFHIEPDAITKDPTSYCEIIYESHN